MSEVSADFVYFFGMQVVVIQEDTQDCGIWNWRELSRAGGKPSSPIAPSQKLANLAGLDRATAVGMMKQLQVLDLNSASEVKPFAPLMAEERFQMLGDNLKMEVEDIEEELAELGLFQRDDSAKVPGVIILNPGQYFNQV